MARRAPGAAKDGEGERRPQVSAVTSWLDEDAQASSLVGCQGAASHPRKVSERRPRPLSPPSLHRYFLIERGKNMCGLAACASYPIPLV